MQLRLGLGASDQKVVGSDLRVSWMISSLDSSVTSLTLIALRTF